MKFKVSILEEQGGYLYFEAKSKEEAREIAQELLDEHGINAIPEKYHLDITHRGTDVHFAEEYKE